MNTLTNSLLKRALSILLVTIMVFSLGIVGITSASAADDKASFAETPVFYFDNSVSGFNGYIYLMIGHNTHSKAYQMNNIAGTNLYRTTVSEAWGDATEMCIFSTEKTWTKAEDTSITHRKNYAKDSCNILKIKGEYKGTFLLTTDSSGELTPNYQKDGYSALNHSQSAYVYTADYGSTTYTQDAAGGTVTANGKYLSAEDKVTERPVMSTGVEATFTQTYARGSEVTFVAAANEGYIFKGWYKDGSEASPIETSVTLKCNPQDTGKYYALFQKEKSVELELSVSPESQSGFLGQTFDVVVKSNAQQISPAEKPVYVLKEGDTIIEPVNKTGIFEVIPATVGTHEYTVIGTLGDFSDYVTFTITVDDLTDFTFDCKYYDTIEEEEHVVITASSKITFPVTYTLEKEDGSTISTENGKFEFSTIGLPAGTVLKYTITATATNPYTEEIITSTTVKNITITITEISEVHPVTIYFKCTDSLSYKPTATIEGTYETVTGEMKKAELIYTKKSGTAQYWWYKMDVNVSTRNPEISFNIVLGSMLDMEHTYTFEAKGKEYYLAVDNLNTNTTTLPDGSTYEYKMMDVTVWPEDMRNWTGSAAHMLWDEATDGPWGEDMAITAANFRCVSVGDANDDGKLNVRDATIIQKDLANITDLSEVGSMVADVNDDGRVTIKDATAIQKAVAGL